ncbi:hypothetical protein RvY_05459, partial [Ramazzottius varieornatus]
LPNAVFLEASSCHGLVLLRSIVHHTSFLKSAVFRASLVFLLALYTHACISDFFVGQESQKTVTSRSVSRRWTASSEWLNTYALMMTSLQTVEAKRAFTVQVVLREYKKYRLFRILFTVIRNYGSVIGSQARRANAYFD